MPVTLPHCDSPQLNSLTGKAPRRMLTTTFIKGLHKENKELQQQVIMLANMV